MYRIASHVSDGAIREDRRPLRQIAAEVLRIERRAVPAAQLAADVVARPAPATRGGATTTPSQGARISSCDNSSLAIGKLFLDPVQCPPGDLFLGLVLQGAIQLDFLLLKVAVHLQRPPLLLLLVIREPHQQLALGHVGAGRTMDFAHSAGSRRVHFCHVGRLDEKGRFFVQWQRHKEGRNHDDQPRTDPLIPSLR